MPNIDYLSCKEIILHVLDLARISAKNYSSGKIEESSFGKIDLSEIAEKNHNDPLFQYLDSLDYDTVKIVETIMYIGRDYYIYDEQETEENNEQSDNEADVVYSIDHKDEPVENPKELFLKFYNDLSSRWPEDGKINEIHQITSKTPLYNYLKRGIVLLGI